MSCKLLDFGLVQFFHSERVDCGWEDGGRKDGGRQDGGRKDGGCEEGGRKDGGCKGSGGFIDRTVAVNLKYTYIYI